MNIITQIQKWHDFTRVLIVADDCASVQLELWDKEQEFGGTVWLYALWCDEAHRRQGYARRLLEEAERIAKEHGHKSVWLDWKEIDTPREVLRWYGRCGYEERAFSGHGDYSLLEKVL